MQKLLIPFTIASLISVAASAQEAGQQPGAKPAVTLEKTEPADVTASAKKGPWSAEKLLDTSIRTPEGEELGEIEDLLVDDNGKIISVVVETDSFLGMGGKHVLLPISDLELTRDEDGNVSLKSNDKAKWDSAPEYNYAD